MGSEMCIRDSSNTVEDPGMSVIAVESIPPVQLSALVRIVFFKLAA